MGTGLPSTTGQSHRMALTVLDEHQERMAPDNRQW